MSESNDLLIRLAALEKENAALRQQQQVPASQPSQQSEASPPPSKMELALARIMQAAKELMLPNNPALDPVQSTASRTIALANLVAELSVCVLNGFGATGAVLNRLNQNIGDLSTMVEELRSLVTQPQQVQPQQATAEVQQESGGEVIEVDNTGASPNHPAVLAQQAAGGKGKGRRPAAVAAVSSAPPVGPSAPTVSGMPAEVAQLMPQAASTAQIASVTIK